MIIFFFFFCDHFLFTDSGTFNSHVAFPLFGWCDFIAVIGCTQWSRHFRLYISPFKCVLGFPGYRNIYISKHKTGFSFLKCNQLVDMLVQHKRIFVVKLKDTVHFHWTRHHSINIMDWTTNHVCQSNAFLSFLSLNIPFNHTAPSWKKKKKILWS